ncbi:MAG: LLM class flavin-dependent oxidoreductase [Deltaproteobacteria bacterium]|nr:LLM class flavin-dependent oxidoreductase [Deltaproteobacteria bacterium]
MKFGLFISNPCPRPWDENSDKRVLDQALEQVELADRLGIDYAWPVEHHFLEEYSHAAAPEMFLAAAAMRTKNIRLAHGIVHCLPNINHPARIAERIAILDLLSNGRAEFGTGEGSSEAELGGFMIDAKQKRAMWDETVRVAVRCMTEEPFTGFKGEFVTMPPRNVVPKPLQKAHPPLWLACSRRETIHLAAQRGMGALAFAFFDPEEARHWVDDYYTTLEEEGVPMGDEVNPNLATVTTFFCHEDEQEAINRGAEGVNFIGYSLGHYYVFGKHKPSETNVWQEYLDLRAEKGYDSDAIKLAKGNESTLGAKVVEEGISGLRGAMGTPDQVRDYLLRYEEAGVDQVIFATTAGKNKHEHIMESMELFAKKVMPEFKEREKEAEAKKAERMKPIIAKVKARKPASDHPPLPEGYEIVATPRAVAEGKNSADFNKWLDDYAEELALGEDVSKRLANPSIDGGGTS